jgi:hypothetical protein
MTYKTKSETTPTNIYIPSHLIGLELEGILQGNLVVKKSHVTIHTFDVITVIEESKCEKTKRTFYQAIAYLNKKRYFVILKKK